MALMENKPTVVIGTIIFENEHFRTNTSTRRDEEPDLVINFNKTHRIPVNKSVMVGRCPFFTSMCGKHGFKEKNTAEIDIIYAAEVTFFKALMKYIHTGQIELSLSTGDLEAMLKAAFYFQLDDLLRFCCNILEQNTNIQTVDNIYNFAKENALNEVKTSALNFKAKHFDSIAKSRVFRDWKLEKMVELLSSDQIVVSHEKKVLKLAVEWLKFDYSNRRESATDIFQALRFPYLSKQNMYGAVMSVTKNIIVRLLLSRRNPPETLLSWLGRIPEIQLLQTLFQVSYLCADKIAAPRIYHKGIYLLEYNMSDDSILFTRYNPEDGSSEILKSPNERQRFHADIAVHNDDIYLVSVVEWITGSNNIHLEKYDVKKNTWISKSAPQLSRVFTENASRVYSVSISCNEEKLFLFLSRYDKTFCMTYVMETDTWQSEPLQSLLSVPFVTLTARCGDCIYFSQRYVDKFLQYKPSTQEITEIHDPRSMYNSSVHGVLAYKLKVIFLAEMDHTGDSVMLMTVYNTNTKEFQSYRLPHHVWYGGVGGTTFAVFKDFLYIFNSRVGKVFKFDLSFRDEIKETTLVSFPHLKLKRTIIRGIASIQ